MNWFFTHELSWECDNRSRMFGLYEFSLPSSRLGTSIASSKLLRNLLSCVLFWLSMNLPFWAWRLPGSCVLHCDSSSASGHQNVPDWSWILVWVGKSQPHRGFGNLSPGPFSKMSMILLNYEHVSPKASPGFDSLCSLELWTTELYLDSASSDCTVNSSLVAEGMNLTAPFTDTLYPRYEIYPWRAY